MAFLDNNIINQLKEVFKKLDKEIKIVNFVSETNEKSKELNCVLHTSAIIGEVEIVDCVINHTSIWAEKTPVKMQIKKSQLIISDEKPIYNWVLANPILYDEPILNIKGKLSFWEFEK